MDYQIDDAHPVYLKVIVHGSLKKTDILNAMKELITHPDYQIKHSLWDFINASQGSIGIWDIKEIVGFLKLYRPTVENFANKCAILVSGNVHKSLFNLYISFSKMLPFKYRIFTDFKEAEDFLTQD